MPRKFLSGIDANGRKIENVANPVAGTDAVNKQYADANPGPAGESFLNADGGEPDTIYGGISPIDGGPV